MSVPLPACYPDHDISVRIIDNVPKTSLSVVLGSAPEAVELEEQARELARSPKELIRDLIHSIQGLKNRELDEHAAAVLVGIKQLFGYQGKYPMRIPLYGTHKNDLSDLRIDNNDVRRIKDTNKDIDVIEVGDIFSRQNLNSLGKCLRTKILDDLERSLRASLFAYEYKPKEQSVNFSGAKGNVSYQTFNDFFVPQDSFNRADLETLQSNLQKRGLFEFKTTPQTGLIQTSDTVNEDMGWQWVTDSCMAGVHQREEDPRAWCKSLVTNASIYQTTEAQDRMQAVIKNPELYRTPSYEADFMKIGVPHIFNPDSIRVDANGIVDLNLIKLGTWAGPKRIESHAMLLRDLLRTMKHHSGSKDKKSWGFDMNNDFNEENKKRVYSTIANLAQYLLAVNYNTKTSKYDLAAPTSSSWEEVCFWKGATWDTALVTSAFEELHDLLFNKEYDRDSSIQEFRTSLRDSENQKDVPKYSQFIDSKRLKDFIELGRERVKWAINIPLDVDGEPYQVEERKADTSLVLLAASDYVFDKDDLYHDAEIRFKLVKKMLEELQGAHGMIRFKEFTFREKDEEMKVHDNYMSFNAHEALNLTPIAQIKAGEIPALRDMTKDSGSLRDYQQRQYFSKAQYAAQWTIGPTAAIQALTRVKHTLLDCIEANSQVEKAKGLLGDVNQELSHTINSSVSHIAGGRVGRNSERLVRADGTYLPKDYAVMEAYQAITDLEGRPKWVPGQHTLNWTTAQLEDGVKRAIVEEHRAAVLGCAA